MAWPTLRLIAFINGIFLITLAIGMIGPMFTLFVFDRATEVSPFAWAGLITFIAGLSMIARGKPQDVHLRPRDMYLLTVSSWLTVCVFAALPFMFTQHMSYTCLLYTSPSPRDVEESRMPSSA